MSDNLQKKPSKGILKTSRSMEQEPSATSSKRMKEQRFDEQNVQETFHPANKDYGHMKVDEPKTPFSESVDGVLQPADELDANILAAKLAASMNKNPKCRNIECKRDEDEPQETEEERERRIEFEKKRKGHYNEYQALKLARKLMEQEDEDDDDKDKDQKKT